MFHFFDAFLYYRTIEEIVHGCLLCKLCYRRYNIKQFLFIYKATSISSFLGLW